MRYHSLFISIGSLIIESFEDLRILAISGLIFTKLIGPIIPSFDFSDPELCSLDKSLIVDSFDSI